MKQVLIEIKGTQQYDDGKPDVTTFMTNGSFSCENGVYKLCYDESEMIGAKGVKTELTVENGEKMTLSRTGGMKSRLVVEKGRRHSCLYNTPQGDFVIGIYGETLNTQLSDNGGSIYMSYTIDVYSGLLSKNIMEIKVKETEECL